MSNSHMWLSSYIISVRVQCMWKHDNGVQTAKRTMMHIKIMMMMMMMMMMIWWWWSGPPEKVNRSEVGVCAPSSLPFLTLCMFSTLGLSALRCLLTIAQYKLSNVMATHQLRAISCQYRKSNITRCIQVEERGQHELWDDTSFLSHLNDVWWMPKQVLHSVIAISLQLATRPLLILVDCRISGPSLVFSKLGAWHKMHATCSGNSRSPSCVTS